MECTGDHAKQGQAGKDQEPDEDDDFNADLQQDPFERQVSIQIANSEKLLRLWVGGLSCKALGHTTGEIGEAFFEYLPEEGPRFGELYDIDAKVVGSGAFSVPYPGHFGEQPCVVKVVDKKLVGDEYRTNLVEAGLYALFIKMTQEHEHPNVVKYLDLLEGPLNYYVVMQRLNGSDLFDQFLVDYPVTEKYIRDVMRQVLGALAHLHDVIGLVHRDVKLGNFRYIEPSASSDLKLLDFGFARHVGFAWEQDISGTLLYLAPEIVAVLDPEEKRVYEPPADVWAAGVMLFILLCGTEPFKEREVWQLGRGGGVSLISRCLRHMALNHWSADAKNLLEKLLTLNPASRITAAQALEHPWFVGARLTMDHSPVPRQNYTLAGETSRRATVLASQKLDVVEGVSTRRKRLGYSLRVESSQRRSLSVGSRSPKSFQRASFSGCDLQGLPGSGTFSFDPPARDAAELSSYPTHEPQKSSMSLGSDDDYLFQYSD